MRFDNYLDDQEDEECNPPAQYKKKVTYEIDYPKTVAHMFRTILGIKRDLASIQDKAQASLDVNVEPPKKRGKKTKSVKFLE